MEKKRKFRSSQKKNYCERERESVKYLKGKEEFLSLPNKFTRRECKKKIKIERDNF